MANPATSHDGGAQGPAIPPGRRGVFGQSGATVDVTIRRTPEDFVVEEIPAYAPSGRGEHLYLTFTKRGLTTLDAVNALARALEVDPRGDRLRRDEGSARGHHPDGVVRVPDGARRGGRGRRGSRCPGITVTRAARHDNKLKPGHLIGNRFTRRARGRARGRGGRRWASGSRRSAAPGVPNAFGPQRFGRDGDNPERALAWLARAGAGAAGAAGAAAPVLVAPVAALQPGARAARGGRHVGGPCSPATSPRSTTPAASSPCPLEGPELDDARARAAAGSLSATGPMFGAKMRWPEGEPAALEREVLAAASTATVDAGARFDAFRHLGEGTRRPLRLFVARCRVEARDPRPRTGSQRSSSPVLCYRRVATRPRCSGRACRLIDASPPRQRRLRTHDGAATLTTPSKTASPYPGARRLRKGIPER